MADMIAHFSRILILFGVLNLAVHVSTHPVEAKWIINRAGDVVYVRPQVLGAETIGVTELDDMGMDDEMMQAATDEMMRELDDISHQPFESTESIRSEQSPGASIKDVGPVPDKFRHIKRKDIRQIRIAPQDAIPTPPREVLVPVGGMGPGEGQHPIKKPGVAVEIQTDKDGLIIHQDALELEKKGGNMIIGPVIDKSNQLEIRRDEYRAKIPFPVKIDPTSQEIRVELPDGDVPLRVMPDQAKVILDTKSKLTLDHDTDPIPEVVDGTLSYTYRGQQTRKLFGLIPISLSKTVHVSAVDGTIIEEPQVGLWNRMKSWLSR